MVGFLFRVLMMAGMTCLVVVCVGHLLIGGSV